MKCFLGERVRLTFLEVLKFSYENFEENKGLPFIWEIKGDGVASFRQGCLREERDFRDMEAENEEAITPPSPANAIVQLGIRTEKIGRGLLFSLEG